MTDEQYVLQQKPKARVKWKQSEQQPTCYIDDRFGQALGTTSNDFPARSIAAAWAQAKQNLARLLSKE